MHDRAHATAARAALTKRRPRNTDVPSLDATVIAIKALPEQQRRVAVEDFLRTRQDFAASLAKRFRGDDVDAEQTALVALWQAIENWEPGRGRNFYNFARWGVYMSGWKEIRRSRVVAGACRTAAAHIDEADEVEAPDAVAAVDAEHDHDSVVSALSALPPLHRRIISAHFKLNVDAEAAAVKLPCSKVAIRALLQAALGRLRAVVVAS